MRYKFALLVSLILTLSMPCRSVAQYGGNGSNVCVIELRDKSGQPIGWSGKGFALRIGGRDFLITTAHGMLEALRITGNTQAIFDTVGAVALKSFANETLATAGRCLVSGSVDGRYDTDVMAFELSSATRMQSLALAPALPPIGTRVWVLSKEGENFSGSAGVDKYPGTVSSSSLSSIFVKLDAPLTALHASGSPVVDGKGQVVGMLCGTGNERKSIGCNPGLAIYQRLYAGQTTSPGRSQSGVRTYK